MIARFSIIPIGKDESLSPFVAEMTRIVEKSGIEHSLTPMGTIVEGGWDEVMNLIGECRKRALEMTGRLLIDITIDDRPGKPRDRMKAKVAAVKKRLREG